MSSGDYKACAPRSRAVRPLLVGVLALLLGAAPGGGHRKMTVYLHGKPLSIRIYDPPPGTPKRPVQVLVTSGDLGWLALSGDLPDHLQAEGYRVIGLNAQSYEVAFTGPNRAHLAPGQIPGDYDTIMQAASVDTTFPAAFVSVGVSEGSGLAIMAMGQPGASPLCVGVIALGLPVHTALAWRWTDFPSWITKAEPNEPLADTQDYLARLAVPLVVIHSIHDEYDAIERVRAMVGTAPEPKRFFPVDAPNHRFSRRGRQVMSLVDSSIVWMDSLRQARATRARGGTRQPPPPTPSCARLARPAAGAALPTASHPECLDDLRHGPAFRDPDDLERRAEQ